MALKLTAAIFGKACVECGKSVYRKYASYTFKVRGGDLHNINVTLGFEYLIGASSKGFLLILERVFCSVGNNYIQAEQ